jgi:hypothetical protein
MQFEPRSVYTIAREIPDPYDVSTYYVRAVIRDARTYTLIDTVDLYDNGDHVFTKEWRLPADSSGQGKQILIKTTVYTDNGYTTKSETYAEELTTEILIKTAAVPQGGWGETDFDPMVRGIEKMINAKIDALPKPEKVDLTPIENLLNHVSFLVESIVIPEQKETDLRPVIEEMKSIENKIDSIVIPEPEKLNLTPALQAIQAIRIPVHEVGMKDVKSLKEDLLKEITSLRKLYKNRQNMVLTIDPRIQEVPEKEEEDPKVKELNDKISKLFK